MTQIVYLIGRSRVYVNYKLRTLESLGSLMAVCPNADDFSHSFMTTASSNVVDRSGYTIHLC